MRRVFPSPRRSAAAIRRSYRALPRYSRSGGGNGRDGPRGTASAVPVHIVSIRHLTLPPILRESVDAARTIMSTRRSQALGAELPQSQNVAFAVDGPLGAGLSFALV